MPSTLFNNIFSSPFTYLSYRLMQRSFLLPNSKRGIFLSFYISVSSKGTFDEAVNIVECLEVVYVVYCNESIDLSHVSFLCITYDIRTLLYC